LSGRATLAVPYTPKDPLTDPPPQPDELRRLNLEQDSSGSAMRPWIVAGLAAIVVVMLVYGYTAPISTTASAPPSRSSPTTTGAAPASSDHQSLGGYTVSGSFRTGPG
jgi:hypothetical protein